ncbi:MAG TPA: adenylate/guanylate cyclase domain-containing protein [Jatrophihabitans sp.]|nr:adenylate/guanylate cyclase domain-containing protein [Jatrophihabitans sp.]
MAERRVCSVLFADLVGFTALSESRDPEQVRELLSRYFEMCRTVIGRYGGAVEKFIGDAVMAVWGTPVAVEGDAERAVRAAIDLVAAVGELGTEVGAAGLGLRAGVVTGEVAVTLGATAEGMVAGDAVNTAARVQSAAAPGTVWVDAATQRLAAAAIGFSDAGEHRLKGKSEPVRLWQAGRVLSGVGGAQRVDGLEAPLTGRDAELRTVKELFHATAERRTPRMVLVSGPAGVGKSRLGWEFEKYIDGLAEVAMWHRGRCLSYGDGVAFWALAEIVRQRFGIAEEDALDLAAAKLVDGLNTFVADAAERSYVGPRLGRLLGVAHPDDTDAPLSREELFAGWRLFFERLADSDPVVLLVEDAHHADPALLDFLDHLVDWARSSPIYVLVFARPELDERRTGWGTGRNRTALTLDPLDARSMDALLAALVPRMPADASARIAAQAQGNPLFAVETVRSLIDRDVVVPMEGVYRLVGDVGALSVPDSLHALLAARLDALDGELRSLVADAAVLGLTFPPEALTAVSGRSDDRVHAALDELVRRGVLEISADPLSPQRGAYSFSQSMLRQVAYDTLSRRDRKARHLAVAAHLRATFANDGDEVMDVVARHYLDALAAVPDDPDATGIRDAAIAALVRAGERAERSGAAARAAEAYAEAAELAEQGSGPAASLAAAGLWERAAAVAVLAGAYPDGIANAHRARDLYLEQDRPRDAARAGTWTGRALRYLGRHAEARESLAAAVTVLRPDPDHNTVIALGELAALENFGDLQSSNALGEEALVLGQALDVPTTLLADLFVTRAIGYAFSNQGDQAVAAAEYATKLAERADDRAIWARALLNLSNMLHAVDPPAAAAAARAAADHARRVGARGNLTIALNNLVYAVFESGDWDEADAVLAHAMHADGLDDEDILRSALAVLAALRGDVETAAANSALPALRASDDPQDVVCALTADGFLAAASGRHGEALRHARDILGYADAIGMVHEHICWAWPLAVRSAFLVGDLVQVAELLALLDGHPVGHLPLILRAERALARARVSAVHGDADTDIQFEDAIAQLRAVGNPYHYAHALLDLAEHRRAVAGPTDVDPLVDEAVAIAERLRAQPLLDRAAATRATPSEVSSR